MRLTRGEAYSILGLQEGSTEDDIRRAYKSQALKWHPDKNQNSTESTERFKSINEAYARLKAQNEDDDEFEMDEDMFDDDMFDDLPHEFFFFFARMMGGQRRRAYTSSVYTTYDAPCDCAQCRMRARASSRQYRTGYGYRDSYSYSSSPPREANRERAEKAREAQSREESEAMERWLQTQLRLKLVSTSDYNIQATLEAVTVPVGCAWEASYRKDADASATWTSVVPKKNGNIYVGSLRPGTDYLFRARPGKSGTYTWSGVAEYTSSWGPSVLLSTTGIAPEYANDGGKKGKKKQGQKQPETTKKEPAAKAARPAQPTEKPSPPQPAPTSPRASGKKSQKGKASQGNSSTNSTGSTQKEKEQTAEEKEQLRLQREAREAAEREKEEQKKKEKERQAALEKATQEKMRLEELEHEKQKEKDRQAAMEHAAAEYDRAVEAAAAQRSAVDKRKEREKEREKEKHKEQQEQHKQHKEREAGESKASAGGRERVQAEARERAHVEERERAQAEAVAKAEAESALKAEEEDAAKTRAEEVARYRAKAEALLRQPADNGRRGGKGLKVHEPAADEDFVPIRPAAAAPTSSDSANVHHLEPCKYFLRGQCMRGDNCWYLHDQAARDKLMEQKYTRKTRTTPVSSPGIAPVSASPQVPTTPIVHSMQSTPPREPSTHPVSKFDQGQSSTPGSRPVAPVGQERPVQTSPAVRSWKPATVIEDPISALEEKMIAKAIEESLRYQQYYQTAVRLDEQDFPDLTTVRSNSKGSDHKPLTPPASGNSKQGFSDLISNSDSAEHADSAHSLDCADSRDLPMSNNDATFSNGDHSRPRPPKVYNPTPNNNTVEGRAAAPGRSMFQEGSKKPPNEGKVPGSSRSNSNGHITVPANGMHGTYENAASVGEESNRKAGKHGKVQGADGFQYGSSSDVDSGKDGGEREQRYGAGGNGVQYGASKLANGYTVKGQYAVSGVERHVEGGKGAGAVEPGYASRSGSSAQGARVLQRPGVGQGAGGGSVDDSSGSEKSEKVRERRRAYVGKVMRPFPIPVPTPVTGTRDTSQQQQQHADAGSYPAAAPTSQHSSAHMRSMDANALRSEAPSFTSHLGGNGPVRDSPEVPASSVDTYDSAARNSISYSYTKVSAAAAKTSGGDDGGTKLRPPAGRMPVPVPVNVPPTSYAPPADATYHERSKSLAGIGRMPVPVPVNAPPFSYAPPSVSTLYQGAKAAAAVAQMPVPVPVNAPPTSYAPPSGSTLYRGAKTAAAAAQMPVPVPVNEPPTSYAPPSGSTFSQGAKVAAAGQIPVPLPVQVNAPPPSYAGTPAVPQTAAAVQYNGMGVAARDSTHPIARASSGQSPHSGTPAGRTENPATPSAVYASPEEEDLDLLTFGIGFSEMDDQIQEELERENASYDNMGAFGTGFGSFGAAAGQLPGESNLQESFGSYYSSSLPSYNVGALTSSPSAPAFGSSLPDSMPPGSTNTSKPANNRNEFPISSPYPGSTLSSSSGLDSQTHSRGLSGSLPPPAHHAFSKITPPPAVAAAFSPASHAHTDFSSASFADWGPPTPGGSTWGPPATLPAAGSLKPPTPNSRGMTHVPPARPRFPVPAPLSLPNGITNPSHLLSPSLSNASMLSPAAKATPNKADASGRAVMTTPPQGGSLTHYAESTSDETSPTAPDSLLNLLISHHGGAKLDSHKPATSATSASSASPRPSRQNPPARPYNPMQAQNSQALTAATPSATDSASSAGSLMGQSSGQPAPSGTGYIPPHKPPPVTQPPPVTTSAITSTAPTGHTPSATKPMPLPILPDSIDPPVNKAPVSTAKPASNPTPSATNSLKHPVTLPPPPAAAALNPNMQYAYFTPAMPHAAYVPNMSYATYPTAVYFDPTTGHPIAPAAPHGQMLAGLGPSYFYPAVPHMVNPGVQFGVNPSGNSGKSAKGNSQERQSGMYPTANAGQPYWPSAMPPANVTGMTFGGQ